MSAAARIHRVVGTVGDEEARRSLGEAFRGIRDGASLHEFPDADALFAALESESWLRESGRRRPDLLLLAPGATLDPARALLGRLKGERRWRRIPVVVLLRDDQLAAVPGFYALGAGGVVRRPEPGGDWEGVARTLVEYWFGTVELPAG